MRQLAVHLDLLQPRRGGARMALRFDDNGDVAGGALF
jgi:hypothetical protein